MANNFANSQDLVELEDIKNNTILLKDGSLRKVLMVGGVNFSLKSQQEQDLITGAYQNFLNSLDFPLHILIHSRKINVQKYLDDLEKRRVEEPSPLLQNQIAEYREFVRQFVQENAIMEKTFLVVVPWYPQTITKQAKGILSFLPFGKGKGKKNEKEGVAAELKQEQDKFASLAQSISQLDQRVDQLTEGLFSIGLEAVVLNDEQLVELFYNFYNPGTIERQGITLPTE